MKPNRRLPFARRLQLAGDPARRGEHQAIPDQPPRFAWRLQPADNPARQGEHPAKADQPASLVRHLELRTGVTGRPVGLVGRPAGHLGAAWKGRRPSIKDEAGSATLLAAALGAMIVTLVIWVLALADASAANQRAQTAADLASLAGAQVLLDGGMADQACRLATSICQANGAELSACQADGAGRLRVEATAATVLGGQLGLTGAVARAQALAGPAY